MQSSLRSGTLTKWHDDRGFGFIQPVDGSPEVFLHISELKDVTRRPQANDTIYYYSVVNSDGKVRAINAFILGARSKSVTPSMSSSMPSSISLGRDTGPNAKSSASFPIAEVILLSILPLFGAMHFTWMTRNPLPLILYPTMSIVTYAHYADDKSRAKRKVWRISEKRLHLCELLGGWLGGFIAQRILRHKSQKASYQNMFWAIVILHHGVWVFWLLQKSQMLRF